HAGVVLTANGQLAQARQYINRALELSDQVRFAHPDRARAVLERIDELEETRRRERSGDKSGNDGTATQ
ncbi:MAG: hypothetical protein ACQEUZ_12025, partial [Pseudomonadota bacterium]